MNRKIIVFVLASIFMMVGCRKDEEITENTRTDVPSPTVTIEASIRGIVTDQDGNALNNVEVISEGVTLSTDENGYFRFPSDFQKEGGSLITFSKNGYFENLKFSSPTPGGTTFLKVSMIQKDQTGTFDASTGGSVSTADGAKVEFTSNSIVDASGNVYSGTVNVYAYWYNPESKSIAREMPGDLRGISAESQEVQLATFGMMAVELESEAGEDLNLASDAQASLRFPVSSTLQANAPDEIPLWSMDETSGYWREEGTAQLIENEYVGNVSHFSFWNCDAPFPVVKINGRVLDMDGNPVPWAEMCISVTTSGLTGYGWTDQAGKFCGKVPKDKTLSISVKDECGNVIYEEAPIGPFGSTTDLGDITIDNTDYSNVVEGTLTNCDGDPVTNGYVVLTFENGYYTVVDVDASGAFESYILNCGTTNFQLQGFDANSLTQTEILAFTTTPGEPLQLGTIQVCEDLGEFIRYKFKIDGEEGDWNLITDIAPVYRIDILDDKLTIVAFYNGLSFQLQVDNVTGPGTYAATDFYVAGNGPGQAIGIGCGADIDSLDIEPCAFNVNITQMGGVGDLLVGNLEATGLSNENISGVNVCAEFRVPLQSLAESVSVCGVVWLDDNKNGIREPGESLRPDTRLLIVGFNEQDNLVFERSATTGSDGSYLFDNLRSDFSYKIRITSVDNYLAGPPDATTDETIDNDFWIVIDGIVQTEQFKMDGGQKLENIDAGIFENQNTPLECWIDGIQIICEGEASTLFGNIAGGSGQYEFSWSNGELGQEITITQSGTYTFIVTDLATNETCVSQIDILSSNIEFSNIIALPARCGNPGSISIVANSFDYEVLLGGISMGFNLSMIEDLMPGTYTITLIDMETGCLFEVVRTVYEFNAFVGNFVWLDEQGGVDNIYDQNEQGFGDVKIRLYEEFGTEAIDSTFSASDIDSSGFYQFEVLDGNYFIEVELPDPTIYEFVQQGNAPSEDFDSNIDPLTGRSDVFTIEDCEGNWTIDIGIKEK